MEVQKTNAPIVQLLSETMPEPIVDVQDGVTYKGYAPMGTDPSQAGWRISKTTVTGTVTIVEYAQSTMDFVSVWNDRADYIYTR